MPKYAEIAKSTNNSQVYKRAIRKARGRKAEINCDYCPYHRGENAGRRRPRKHSRRDHRR